VLPHVERGTVTLIGATTENPSFEVNSALLSRTRVFPLKALSDEQVGQILQHTLSNRERGLGLFNLIIDSEVLPQIALIANGDARTALNILEIAAQADPSTRITTATIEDIVQHRTLLYDKGGDQHYDAISALHKALRGSDPDAGLYWLARMLEAGEDPLYVVRRLIRFASEDVGMADPSALKQSSFFIISGTVISMAQRNGQSPCVG
jgi:putative ATPase